MARYNRSRSYRGRSNRSSSFTRCSHCGYSNNRNAQYRISNGGKLYPIVKEGSRLVRDHMSPDIFGKIKDTGPSGQAFGFCGDKLIKKPLNKACFNFVGIFYDKNKDNPVVGSLLYFIVFMLATSLLAAIVGLFVR